MNREAAEDEVGTRPFDSDGREAETDQIEISNEEVRENRKRKCDSVPTPKAAKKEKAESLHAAVETGDLETVKLLLSEGLCVEAENKFGLTPLQCAVTKNDLEIAELLLDWGADVHARAGYAILSAALVADAKMVKMLLSKGADTKAKNAYGDTPLHIAAALNRLDVAEVLCDAGADVNASCEIHTPLLTVFPTHIEMIKFLLHKGACVNAKTEGGLTALHSAVSFAHVKNAELLLEWGADVNAEDINGHTPLDLAPPRNLCSSNSRANLAKILKRHIIKLKTSSFFVSGKNLQAVSEDGDLDYQLECEEEMERLKNEHIVCDGLSLADVLTKDVTRLARLYARSENTVQVSHSGEFDVKFPIYGRIVNARYREFVERRESLQWGHEHFDSLFLPPLPSDCIEGILDYLSNYDLKNCCDALCY